MPPPDAAAAAAAPVAAGPARLGPRARACTPSPAPPAPAPTTTPFSLLSEVFPHHSARAIRAALTAHGGDPSAAASQLAAARPAAARRPRPAAAAARAHRAFVAENAVQTANARRPRAAAPALAPAARAEVVAALRAQVVPALRGHFSALAFADYEDVQPGYVFELRDVAVAALRVPDDAILVGAVAGGFRVHVLGGFLDLDVGAWRYSSTRLFGFDDGGAARVTAQDMTASAMLVPRVSGPNRVALDLTDVDVSFDGPFRLRAAGTSADWAYNAAAALLKPLVVAYVRAAVSAVVRDAVAAQLRGWTAWEAPPAPPAGADAAVTPERVGRGRERAAPGDPGRRGKLPKSCSPVSGDEAPRSPPTPPPRRHAPAADDDEVRPADELEISPAR